MGTVLVDNDGIVTIRYDDADDATLFVSLGDVAGSDEIASDRLAPAGSG